VLPGRQLFLRASAARTGASRQENSHCYRMGAVSSDAVGAGFGSREVTY
jgi:hypothetical protein